VSPSRNRCCLMGPDIPSWTCCGACGGHTYIFFFWLFSVVVEVRC